MKNKHAILRIAKKCLDTGVSPLQIKYREANLILACKLGKHIFFGVSKYKYTMPEGEATWSTTKCLQAWLEAAKTDKQIDLFEGVQNEKTY